MRVIAPALAVLAGLIVLLGSFLPIPLLTELRALLLRWGTILAGTAALVGFYNLLAVHWRNLRAGGLQVLYSFVLILAALGLSYLSCSSAPNPPPFTPGSSWASFARSKPRCWAFWRSP